MPTRVAAALFALLLSAGLATGRADPLVAPVVGPAPLITDARAATQVLALVSARLEIMPDVAAVKWRSGAKLRDARREREVARRAGDDARRLGLAPSPVVAFVELQMRLSRDVQRRRLERWRAHGYDGPAAPPDLGRELRPRIDRLGRETLVALHIGLPALSDRATVDAAIGAVRPRLDALGVTGSERRALARALAALRRAPAPPLERIRASGVLRVGTTGDYAPFSLERDGAVLGADIALARELAAALGVEPVFVRTSWPTLLPDLAADRYDVALSGVSITAERRAVAAFSPPYHHGGKTAIARCAERDRLDTLAEIDAADVRVIVNPGGTNERFAREHLHAARIVVEADNRTVFDALVARRADVMITDDVEVALQTRLHPELCRTMEGLLTQSDKAILMPRDAALGTAIDDWLEPALAAGLPARLLDEAMATAH